LCRYGTRPAFAHERLAWTADGQIAYRLKRPWPDGRTELVLPPVAFLRRLCGIILSFAITRSAWRDRVSSHPTTVQTRSGSRRARSTT
jgi:hypothetical protein